MKAIKFIAILAMAVMSFSAQAVCPVQETMVMYINGVDVKWKEAEKSKDKIRDELLKEGITEDCVKFDFVYNTNEVLFADWLESAFQKADEFGEKPETFWRQWLRTVDGPVAFFFNEALDFLGSASRTVIDAGEWVLGDQKDEHLARFRTEINMNGRQLILVPHSQGNLYANEEYAELTATEKAKTHIVATATPASFVADNGPYTSVNEDILVQTIFAAAGALAPNTSNLTERCEGELASINRWLCHGFKEEYMAEEKPSRDKIVGAIIAALLPVTPQNALLQGRTFRLLFDGSATIAEGGTLVRFRDSNTGTILAETASDPNGSYAMGVPGCAECFLEATKFIPSDGTTYRGFSDSFETISGITYNMDVTIFHPPILE